MTEKKKTTSYPVKAVNPVVPGAFPTEKGYYFGVEIPEGKKAELLLYKKGKKEPFLEVPLLPEERIGRMSAVTVENIRSDLFAYRYRIDGKICQDPFAFAVSGREKFGEVPEEGGNSLFGLLPKLPAMRTMPLNRPMEEMILYKLHVRGFTKGSGSGVRHRGTFRGVMEKIPYLSGLGINAVELMPVYEFEEKPFPENQKQEHTNKKDAEKRLNYWGYGANAEYCAPKAAYSSDHQPGKEFAELVDSLHEAGMECILDFYFAPGTSSLFALRVLHSWLLRFHVDGFRIVGDTSLAEEGARDALLSHTKLIFEGFDGRKIYQDQIPEFRNLAESHQGYEQTMRRFLKGDEGMVPSFVQYLERSPKTNGVVNYFADHDGFTMADMVSYNCKRNEANGERNEDGKEENYSWNCGTEGPTRKPSVRALRVRQLKNAFLILLSSRGTPMIYAGDEFGNSQQGNNNAWCQDNVTGWVDWKQKGKFSELTQFVKAVICFRKQHPCLFHPLEPRMVDYQAYGCPDASLHGESAWYTKMEKSSRTIGVMYCGRYYEKVDGQTDDTLYIGYNMHWKAQKLALPGWKENRKWYLIADTSREISFLPEEEWKLAEEKTVQVPARSIVIYLEKQEQKE